MLWLLAESRDDDTETISKNGGLLQIAGGKLLERGEYPHVVNAEFVETVTKAAL